MSRRNLTDEERMSEPEAAFLNAWHRYAQERPEPLYDSRAFDDSEHRFDFQWKDKMCAVEIDGGNRMARIVFTKRGNPRAVAVGRHTQSADYLKLNKAVARGWRVFRFTPEMLRDDPIECVNYVLSVVEPLPFSDPFDIIMPSKENFDALANVCKRTARKRTA